MINNKYDKVENITYELINYSLIKYSFDDNMNGDYIDILNTPPGRERRSLHDDITIITCDLTKFY